MAVIIKERIDNFSYCQVKRMCKLFKHSFKTPKPKEKIEILKGKDGKKGLKINGKLVLDVEYDRIDVTGRSVFFDQYGVTRMALIEELLERLDMQQ